MYSQLHIWRPSVRQFIIIIINVYIYMRTFSWSFLQQGNARTRIWRSVWGPQFKSTRISLTCLMLFVGYFASCNLIWNHCSQTDQIFPCSEFLVVITSVAEIRLLDTNRSWSWNLKVHLRYYKSTTLDLILKLFVPISMRLALIVPPATLKYPKLCIFKRFPN
jgi:hypothetical protein